MRFSTPPRLLALLSVSLLAACASLAPGLAPGPALSLPYQAPHQPEGQSGYTEKPGWQSSRFAVAAANPLATDAGYQVIQAGGSALDAVEQGARWAESELCNPTVGRCGNPDRDGNLSLDASIMAGDGRCGSVAALSEILHDDPELERWVRRMLGFLPPSTRYFSRCPWIMRARSLRQSSTSIAMALRNSR